MTARELLDKIAAGYKEFYEAHVEVDCAEVIPDPDRLFKAEAELCALLAEYEVFVKEEAKKAKEQAADYAAYRKDNY
jgi:hypothetical protein